MNKSEVASESRDKVAAELRNVIRDAESLLKSAAGGVDLSHGRERLNANLHAMRRGLGQAEETLIQRTREMAHNTDDYVQNHAWQSVGAGALAGLVLGMLISRR